jgi:hypothetical protein
MKFGCKKKHFNTFLNSTPNSSPVILQFWRTLKIFLVISIALAVPFFTIFFVIMNFITKIQGYHWRFAFEKCEICNEINIIIITNMIFVTKMVILNTYRIENPAPIGVNRGIVQLNFIRLPPIGVVIEPEIFLTHEGRLCFNYG